jgi:diguanylate cyclase (GGDEF)-like protein
MSGREPGASPSAVLDLLAADREAVRVLLVEDNPGDRRLVAEMLREGGDATVLTTCDRLADSEEPITRGLADLVLLDLSLPDSEGLDGLRRLRTVAPEVPVVVLSGLIDEQVALEAVQAGAQDYLMKGRVDAASLSRAMHYEVERQRAERRLVRLALRDPLTGLPNRVLLADRLEQALARAARAPADEPGREGLGGQLVLMFVDLDGFKSVNDRLGHHCGDQVLIQVGRRLRAELRGSDTVARLGGDEFTVVCEGVADDVAAMALAERLGSSVAQPYLLDDGPAEVTAAIGVAVAQPGQEDAGRLLRRADAAMYAAKRDGRGRCAMAPVSSTI